MHVALATCNRSGMDPEDSLRAPTAKVSSGASGAARAAKAERRLWVPKRSAAAEIRPCKLFGQALSHVQCYVPRNTTRASTAFTP